VQDPPSARAVILARGMPHRSVKTKSGDELYCFSPYVRWPRARRPLAPLRASATFHDRMVRPRPSAVVGDSLASLQ